MIHCQPVSTCTDSKGVVDSIRMVPGKGCEAAGCALPPSRHSCTSTEPPQCVSLRVVLLAALLLVAEFMLNFCMLYIAPTFEYGFIILMHARIFHDVLLHYPTVCLSMFRLTAHSFEFQLKLCLLAAELL